MNVEKNNKGLSKLGLFFVTSVILGGIYFVKEKDEKMNKIEKVELEKVRWDLKDFGYSSYKDEQIEKDVLVIESMMKDLTKYRGKVIDNLEDILRIEIALNQLENKVFAYLMMLSSQDSKNQELQKLQNDYGVRLSQLGAEIEFINLEIGAVSPEKYKKILDSSDFLAFHKPMLDKIINNAKYNLEENVEKILTKTGSFNSSPWDQTMDELDTRIRFDFEGKKISKQEIGNILREDLNAERRQGALDALVKTIQEKGNGYSYAEMQAKTLNNIMGIGSVMRKERGLNYPMESRNIANMVSKEVVDTLHDVIANEGREQAIRYYKIIAKLTDKKKLTWADRNAKPVRVGENKISWNEGAKNVLDSYYAFSPKMGDIAKELFDDGKIDAHVYDGKFPGGYSVSFIIPENKPQTYIIINYLEKEGDVFTLSHEVGHSVHGILAEKKQGSLMHNAPMVYAETASKFGEMLTFTDVISKKENKKEKLSMLLDKSHDWVNYVVDSASCSDFEQTIHKQREVGELLVEDFNEAYLNSVKKYFASDKDDVLDYTGVENLWVTRGHYRQPFYMYAYAFGELFTQSLFAVKDNFKEGEFEQLYIEMLEKGGTQGAVDLMKPFGLNPSNRDFWVNGVNVSIKVWLDEAEKLIEELGL